MTATASVPSLAGARPARGRLAPARFAFGVCYADQLEATAPHVAHRLAVMTGPTRTGAITAEAHAGDAIGRTLDTLDTLGQSADVLLGLAEAVHRMQAASPDRPVLLVVAACRVLWVQTARTVHLS